jgi:hypothetical protein
MKKEFSEQLYKEDDNAKNLIGKWLANRWGFTNVRVNPDKYGIDLLADKDGASFGIEVEVKHNWSGARFPFNSVDYAARKTKFLEAAETVYFCTLNEERTHVLILSSDHMDGVKLIRKETVYTSAEWFIRASIDKCFIYEL